MKAMKGLNMNRMLGSVRRRPTNGKYLPYPSKNIAMKTTFTNATCTQLNPMSPLNLALRAPCTKLQKQLPQEVW